MTLLDDARQLARSGIGMYCDACTGSPESGHFDQCPMLSLPKIVAALEVADQMEARFTVGSFLDDSGTPTVLSCELCGESAAATEPRKHSPRCRIGALAAAFNPAPSEGQLTPTT